MKAVCKKLFSLMLVAILLVSAVPFQASAEETVAPVTEAPTVVTEAAAVEAAAAEVESEITATTPAVNAEVITKDVVYVEFEIEAGDGEYRIGNLVKSKIGSKVSTPSETTVLNTLKTIIGTSAGYELIRWELEDGSTFTSSTIINLGMEMEEDAYYDEKNDTYYPILHVNAIVEKVAKTITLKPNGGTVANTKFQVMIGERYDTYGGLPLPTKSGASFLGWYKEDGTLVSNETVVTDLSNLTAKWATGKYTVTYKGYTDGGWDEVGFGSFDVDNNSVLKTDYNNFPTTSQISALFALEGWTIDGWEYSNDDEATWKTFTAGKTKITGTTTIRPIYKKSITLYACDTGNTKRSLTVTLDKNYPTLPHPGTRDGLAFMGWYTEEDGAGDLISDVANLSNVSKHPVVTVDVEALYADWEVAKTVYLYIYTNGNTEEHTKLVKYYDVPATGFDLTTIDLAEIFPNYGKYDDKGDEKWGWYNETQWENYCLGRQKYDTTETVDASYFEDDDIREFHIMLIDNGNNASSGSSNGTGYNDNKTTVDSSNPSTGDDIFVAVAIMAVSACAVLLIFMNKKRIVK